MNFHSMILSVGMQLCNCCLRAESSAHSGLTLGLIVKMGQILRWIIRLARKSPYLRIISNIQGTVQAAVFKPNFQHLLATIQ